MLFCMLRHNAAVGLVTFVLALRLAVMVFALDGAYVLSVSCDSDHVYHENAQVLCTSNLKYLLQTHACV